MDLAYGFASHKRLNETLVAVNQTLVESGDDTFLTDMWFLLLGIFTFVGLVTNFTLIVAIKKSPRLKAPIFRLLFAIAITDVILVIAFSVPEIGRWLGGGRWIFGFRFCTLLEFLQLLPSHVGSCLIAVGCWERFYAVCRPHSALGWITTRKMSGIIAIIFIMNAGALIPILVMSKPVDILYKDGSMASACQLEMPKATAKLYFTIMGMLFYGITSILSSALSLASICKACRIDLENYFIKDDFKNHIMRCCVAITVLSIILWLPYRYVYFHQLHSSEPITSEIPTLAVLMVLLSAAAKPIVYVVASSQFKKAIVQALRCCTRSNMIDYELQPRLFKLSQFCPPESEPL